MGPRFWFLADSIRQNESPRMCCNILINGNFEQGGYSGSDREAGDGGGRDLHRQRLPHQGWQPQGVPPSLDQNPTKPESNLNVEGGAEAEAGRHEGTGCGEK